MNEVVVSAEALRKQFGDREVIRDVDFDIPAGICFGILGPNGAGKTTLIRMLLGMSPVSAGNYRLFGRPVHDRGLHARVGVVPQMDNLDPDFTVQENLTVFASFFGIAATDVVSRLDDLLDFAALSGRENDTVASLSGGMRRRLMVARALINEPELVILDEPTTGLDPQARHLIWQRLRSLKRRGKTLILTTHYMEEAQELCDEIMVLDQGRVLDRGSPDELIARHVEPEVVALRGLVSGMDVHALCEGLDVRLEHVGDTWFCYMQDARPLLARCADAAELSFIHRPASLEDVFLTLTGRELREDA